MIERFRAARQPLGGVLLVLALLAAATLILLGGIMSRPISVTDDYGSTSVTFAADRRWVLLPGDCVQLSWTLDNAESAAFYPIVRPGLAGEPGVRSVFFRPTYLPGPGTVEDASGGTTESFEANQRVSRTSEGCPDFASEPKFRVHFADGTSRPYTLGLDVYFLRVEVWLLIFAAAALAVGGLWLRGWLPSRYTAARVLLWLSALMLLFYGLVVSRFPSFVAVYSLDALLFIGLLSTVLSLTGLSVLRPAHFDSLLGGIRPTTSVWLVVIIVWVWVLSLGYASTQHALVSEMMWLPLFVWAFVVGVAALWWSRPRNPGEPVPPSRRISLALALGVAVLAIARDVVLFQTYSLAVYPDSESYVVGGREFASGEANGIPMRIFPYLLLNFVTGSAANPLPLLAIQSLIGAGAAGFLTYVLSRRHWWLGAGVGFLLALNFTWGTFNRSILTEGPYISFHVICLAFVLWHHQRRRRLPLWELIAFGALCGWTFLFRGTGLPLIVPVAALYYAYTRRWATPLAIVAGFAIFLLAVGTYNRLRHGEFGLVGPQHGTLASALFSYHLFSPQNGPVSQEIDAALRECMGYLDYHDVPRYTSNFVFIHHGRCLTPKWGLDAVTASTTRALFEIVRRRPFEFARVLLQEAGNGLAIAATDEFVTESYLAIVPRRYENCRDPYTAWCETYPKDAPAPEAPLLTALNSLLTYPNQVYLAVDQVSSRSAAVALAAFVMFCGFVYVTAGERLLVVVGAGFVFYQLATVSVAHVFFPRYGVVLGPMFTVMSVAAVGHAVRQVWRSRTWPGRLWIPALIVIAVYFAWANPVVRREITAPLLARAGVNALQKYGVTTLDFEVYRALLDRSGVALALETVPARAHSLSRLGVVYHVFDLRPFGQSRIRGWEFTRLPGYLRDADISYLLLDADDWSSLPPPDQTRMLDPAHYRLIGEWHSEADSRRLFEVVGAARETFPAYEGDNLVVFEQPDRALDVYRLDENRNGIFVAHIDPSVIQSGTLLFEGEAGWDIEFRPTARGGLRMRVRDGAGRVVGDSFEWFLP